MSNEQTGQMLLIYELRDDPRNEHEVWVDDVADARRHLQSSTDMLDWAAVYDAYGDEVADTQALI